MGPELTRLASRGGRHERRRPQIEGGARRVAGAQRLPHRGLRRASVVKGGRRLATIAVAAAVAGTAATTAGAIQGGHGPELTADRTGEAYVVEARPNVDARL